MSAFPMSSVNTTAPCSNRCPKAASDFMFDGHCNTSSFGPQLSTTSLQNCSVVLGTVLIGQIASGLQCAVYHSTTPVTKYSATMVSTNSSLSVSKHVCMLGQTISSQSNPTNGKHISQSRMVAVACPRYSPKLSFHAAHLISISEVKNVGMGLRQRRLAPSGSDVLC
eukprot:1476149-Rhodomonas_salina.4